MFLQYPDDKVVSAPTTNGKNTRESLAADPNFSAPQYANDNRFFKNEALCLYCTLQFCVDMSLKALHCDHHSFTSRSVRNLLL